MPQVQIQKMQDSDRLELLLYFIDKIKNIDTYSKLYSILYLINSETGIFSDYHFNSKFLTYKDNILDNDLKILWLQDYIKNRESKIDEITPIELAHKHIISISDEGERHLNLFDIEKKLKKKFGSSIDIDKMVKLSIMYNKKSNNELVSLINK